MMVSDHIDSNLPRSSSRIAGVHIAQSRCGMQFAALNMEKDEGRDEIGSKEFWQVHLLG